ncbi:hypothetical protein CPB97_011099 [Podila verticillata]|nr:hypothetical protein CPB97_011099 [Podila verticillata]
MASHRPSTSRESTSNSNHSSTSSQFIPTTCERSTVTKATVIIVGSGIGGLTLAALLEQAGIEYQVFERAREVRPLGSALSIGPNVFYLFKQLGILDEILSHAKPFGFSTGYNLQRQATRTLDYSPTEKIGGYLPHIISRPILVSILLRLVPANKISYSKKILQVRREDEHVIIKCSDNSEYQSDILVGADGAYSSVRQNLYRMLNTKGKLPKSDIAVLPFNSVCLVGQTTPLDPEVFTHLKDSHTWFETMVSPDKPYAWITFTSKQNTVCWMMIQNLDAVSSKANDSFRNSEWGPEAAEAMCKDVREFPVARNSMTMGDLIDKTPKDLISKVMLEEKLFDTWHGDRIVLLGDGAVSAMQDAVTLANCLYELPQYPSTAEINKAFKHYQNERYPFAKNAYDTSHRLAGVVGTSWYNHAFRTVMKWMPKSLFTKSLVVMYSYRPQASFLEYVPDKGQIKPTPQPSLERARARARGDLAKANKARAV